MLFPVSPEANNGTGLSMSPSEGSSAVPDQAVSTPPEPQGQPAETTPPQTTTEAKPATTTEVQPVTTPAVVTPEPGADFKFKGPDGKEYSWQEFETARQSGLLMSDYTKKTQELGEQRKQVEAEVARVAEQKRLADLGVQRLLENPDHYAKLRQDAGLVPKGPDPIADAGTWAQARYQQYVAAGREAEATDAQIRMDLILAQNRTMMDRLNTQETAAKAAVDQAARAADDARRGAELEQAALQYERARDGMLADKKNATANTPLGKDLVDAFVAKALNANQPVDLAAIVAKVADLTNTAVKQYGDTKTQDANSTAPHMRGGGAPRVPDKPKFDNTIGAFGQIAKHLSGGGTGG